MDSERIGNAACMLGAGRKTKEDSIDPAAGLEILAKTGSKVCKGDVLAKLHTNDEKLFDAAANEYKAAITLSDTPVEVMPIILGSMR